MVLKSLQVNIFISDRNPSQIGKRYLNTYYKLKKIGLNPIFLISLFYYLFLYKLNYICDCSFSNTPSNLSVISTLMFPNFANMSSTSCLFSVEGGKALIVSIAFFILAFWLKQTLIPVVQLEFSSPWLNSPAFFRMRVFVVMS